MEVRRQTLSASRSRGAPPGLPPGAGHAPEDAWAKGLVEFLMRPVKPNIAYTKLHSPTNPIAL